MPLAGKHYLPREIAKLAYNAGWTNVDNLIKIVAVCYAESSGYGGAYHDNDNGTRDVGLMQIDIPHDQIGTTKEKELYDPVNNFKAARNLYKTRKFQPWVAYNSGAYKKYMKKATLGVANFMAIKHGYAKPDQQTFRYYA